MTRREDVAHALLIERFATSSFGSDEDEEDPDPPKACAMRRARLLEAIREHDEDERRSP